MTRWTGITAWPKQGRAWPATLARAGGCSADPSDTAGAIGAVPGRALPLPRGFYVSVDTPCAEASNAPRFMEPNPGS